LIFASRRALQRLYEDIRIVIVVFDIQDRDWMRPLHPSFSGPVEFSGLCPR